MENSEQQAFTPGEMLRTAREAQGISPREMADRLNWMPTYLNAVEENRFEVLRGTAFARGYLRAYAKQIDIPESSLLEAFDALQAPESSSAEESIEADSQSPLKKPEVGIALGLACAVLLIAGLWWWQSDASKKPAPLVTNVSERRTQEVELEETTASAELLVAAEQFAATEAALEESALEQAEAEVADAELADSVLVPDQALDQPLDSPVEDTDLTAVSNAMLQFRFSGDCWVEVRNGNDELIYADLRRNGDSLNLDDLPPFNITLGDSRYVELRFRGEPVTIRPRPGRVLARFSVGVP